VKNRGLPKACEGFVIGHEPEASATTSHFPTICRYFYGTLVRTRTCDLLCCTYSLSENQYG
jgi:hypothetical protein